MTTTSGQPCARGRKRGGRRRGRTKAKECEAETPAPGRERASDPPFMPLRAALGVYSPFPRSSSSLLLVLDVGTSLPQSGEVDVDTLFRTLDRNNDGAIQLTEWLDHLPRGTRIKIVDNFGADAVKRSSHAIFLSLHTLTLTHMLGTCTPEEEKKQK